MKRRLRVLGMVCLLVGATTGYASGDPSAPASQRAGAQIRNDGLGGIGGWEPIPNVCGTSSATPVVVTNTYDQPQSLSITVNDDLSSQVYYYPTWSDYEWSQMAAGCPG